MLHRNLSYSGTYSVAGGVVPLFFMALLIALLVGLGLSTPLHAQATTEISGPEISGRVIVRPGGAELYDAPNGEVVGSLATSTVFTATGRTEDKLWVMGWAAPDAAAGTEEDARRGWLEVTQVIAIGVEFLRVADESAVMVEGAPASTQPTATPPLDSEAEDSGAEPAATPAAEVGMGASDAGVMGTVVSGDDRLNVRSGPGVAYPILAKALSGERYPVIGRTEDGAWLQIGSAESSLGAAGWVSASYLLLAGDVSGIPVVTDFSPPPVATPVVATQTAAPSGAAVVGSGGGDAGGDLRGTLVIESSPGGMIYAYALGSGALWPLSNGFDPAISPDGQTVAFVRDGGENGIYLVDIDGSNERLIFSGRTRLSSPKWSPDGQWILFTRSDGSYQCLEFGSGCISPPSGPNGEEITIPGADSVTRYWYNLARVDRDGNNYRDIASLTSARAADWNTAGIVYESAAGLQLTADVPDAENKLVIFDYLKPFYVDPDWQPDGGRIVYMGKEASHWEIFAVNPDGSGKRALTRPVTTVVDEIPSNVAPAWSSDGQHLVFLSNREADGEAGAWRVWMMDADGSNQRALPVDVEITYTFGGEQSLDWTP